MELFLRSIDECTTVYDTHGQFSPHFDYVTPETCTGACKGTDCSGRRFVVMNIRVNNAEDTFSVFYQRYTDQPSVWMCNGDTCLMNRFCALNSTQIDTLTRVLIHKNVCLSGTEYVKILDMDLRYDRIPGDKGYTFTLRLL